MSVFNNLVPTDKGILLQQKVQSGVTLELTRIAIGDGTTATPLNELESLINEKKTVSIETSTVEDNSYTKIRGSMTNTGLAEGYYIRELGLFANDPDDGEILFAVSNAEDLADYFPEESENVVEYIFDLIVTITSDSITIVNDPSIIYVTREEFDKLKQDVYETETALTVSLTTENPVQSTASEVENGQGASVTVEGNFVKNEGRGKATGALTVDGNGTYFGIKNDNTIVAITTYDATRALIDITLNHVYYVVALIDDPTLLRTLGFRKPDNSNLTVLTNGGNDCLVTADESCSANMTIRESVTDSGTLNVSGHMIIDLGLNSTMTLEEARAKYSFVEGVQPLTNLLVSCVGENLLDVSKCEQGGFNSSTGEGLDSTIRLRTDFIPVKANTTYIDTVFDVNYQISNVLHYDKNKDFLGISSRGAITTPSNVAYNRYQIRRIDNADLSLDDLATILPMVIEGSTAPTEYKPYVESKDLYEGELIALPDGTKDVLRWLEDGTCEKDKWIEKFVFDGSENWSNLYTGLTNVCRAIISDFATDNQLVTLKGIACNDDGIIESTNSGDALDAIHFSLLADNHLYLYADKTAVTNMPSGLTLEGFKEYFASKPATAWFKRDVTDPKETIKTGKAITTFSEKCTFSVESGIVEREKAVPGIRDTGDYYGLNMVGNPNYPDTPFDFKVTRINKIWKEVLVDGIVVQIDDTANWIIQDLANAYGIQIAYITDELFNSQANYYVDYEILHAEYNNQQVNATIKYKNNLHDFADYANQAINRIDGQQSENTKQIAELVASEEVFEPTLLNGWVNYGIADYPDVQYWKDSHDNVHIIGTVKDGTIATGLFILPEGYRPAKHTRRICYLSGGGLGYVNINTGGGVTMSSTHQTFTGLGHIIFKAGR